METKTKNIFIKGAIPLELIAQSIKKYNIKEEIGAYSIFLGQVRADLVNNKEVQAIEFTAYEDMAIIKLSEISKYFFDKYKLMGLVIYHSLGKVYKGDICLFVLTASRHRKSAIEACDEVLVKIKKELPIWGKELFEDGTYFWKENK